PDWAGGEGAGGSKGDVGLGKRGFGRCPRFLGHPSSGGPEPPDGPVRRGSPLPGPGLPDRGDHRPGLSIGAGRAGGVRPGPVDPPPVQPRRTSANPTRTLTVSKSFLFGIGKSPSASVSIGGLLSQ